jgi:hypothetical protein
MILYTQFAPNYKFVFSYLVYGKIWPNLPMDDHHFGHIL